MTRLFGFLLLICIAGVALGTDREFGHPLFRTFNAHDYGEVGQVFSVTEDPQGPMLFGCEDAIMVFDNNRWETIPAPGTGYIRSFAADSRGVVWFTSTTQIGYLSKVDGKYRVVKVYDGSLGIGSHVIVDGDRLYFASQAGLLEWNDGHISQHPWPTDSMTHFPRLFPIASIADEFEVQAALHGLQPLRRHSVDALSDARAEMTFESTT
jgi:hypothetical protein